MTHICTRLDHRMVCPAVFPQLYRVRVVFACTHCRGVAEESGRSATVQVPLKHRATRENQNRDSCCHTRSRESAVEDLARTNADRERRQMRTIGRGDRQGRNRHVKQHFINDHGGDERNTGGPVADIRSANCRHLWAFQALRESTLSNFHYQRALCRCCIPSISLPCW